VFLLGETAMGWNGDDLAANLPEYQTISRYVGEFALSGQFDFVLYHGVSYRVWATEEKSLIHADYWEQQSLAQYPQGAIMTPFIGSHDSSRFVSLAEAHGTSDLPSHKWVEDGLPAQPTADIAYQRTALGYVWLLGLPGAPLVYYGDEYGEYGGADPDNRHMWRPPAARNAREAALYQTISRMGRARRDHVALRDGDYRTVLAEETFLVYARETTAPGEIAFVVLNRGAAAVSRSIPVPAGVSSLSNALDPSAPAIPVSGGNATIDVPAMTPMLLVPTP
jgi:glycosidase